MSQILSDIEELMDLWVRIPGVEVPMTIDIHDRLDGCSREICDEFRLKLRGYIDLYGEWAQKGPDLVGCDLSITGIRNRLRELNNMYEDSTGKRVRNTKKKTVDPSKVTKNLCFHPDSKVNPVDIITNGVLYTFDVEKRVLKKLVSTEDGFTVRGTTIFNLKPESYSIILRRPDLLLPLFDNCDSERIDRYVSKLTTKPKPTNGRMNDKTLLLKLYV